MVISINDIISAHEIIRKHCHLTPVFSCSYLNQISQAKLFFKLECFQKLAAFKARGAINAIFNLTQEQLSKGVVTHSSGNHGQALAWAANKRQTKSYVVMPGTAPEVKKKCIAELGAEIIYSEATTESRIAITNKVAKKTGATYISSSNDKLIIAGQGTATLEFLEQRPELEVIVTPVGGGGLLSGTAIAAKSINPKIKVYGSEPLNVNDAYTSFKTGILSTHQGKSVADGLLIFLGDITFPIIQQHVDNIICVTEEQIVSAMKLFWERLKIIIEPSSAVAVASVINNPEIFKNKQVGIVISGGNVDLEKLPF